MIDFIDPGLFYATHINVATIVAIFMFINSQFTPVDDFKNIAIINFLVLLFLSFIIIFVGLRPVSGAYFGDMTTYSQYFNYYANGGVISSEKDVFFHSFMKFCAQIMSMHYFFLLCSFLYVFPMYKISKNHFGPYWAYSALILIVSFSFWTYATNGIRNGLATSLFLWGIAYYDKKVIMFTLFVFAALTHQTLLLPIAAFLLTFFYNNPKAYLTLWFLCIPLSIGLGGFWEGFFASLGFGDGRLGGYLLGEADPEAFKSVGFRWDFLIYSGSAVFTGWYFIIKRKFDDKLYIQLFNTYVLANAFWILVIRANFSNRFAYLSWFMIAVIIIYPFLKQKFYTNQHKVIGLVIMAYFSFTLFMFYVYYGNQAY